MTAGSDPSPRSARPAREAAPPGDDTFDAFYRREFAPALHRAWSLTGRRAVAEEVCQEAFLSAHRHWAKVARYDAPELWLRRVVTNRCVSVFRRRASETRYLRARSSRPADEHLDPEPPDEELWASVRKLPRRQAQVVALVYVGDLTITQAAAAMSCSVETARTHLRRALATLESRLTDEEPEVARAELQQRESGDGARAGARPAQSGWPAERGDGDGS
jgi:RNA polymerase sigma factor (sigma-70 family)